MNERIPHYRCDPDDKPLIEDRDKHQIQFYHDLMSQYMIEDLDEMSRSYLSNEWAEFKTNLTHWHPDVIAHGNSGLVYVRELTTEAEKDLINYLSNKIVGRDVDYAAFYYWCDDAFIPFHNDASHEAALTIYINERDFDLGGLFQYCDPGKTPNTDQHCIKTFWPRAGDVTYVKGVYHAVTPVQKLTEMRRTVQCWYFKKDDEQN